MKIKTQKVFFGYQAFVLDESGNVVGRGFAPTRYEAIKIAKKTVCIN